MQELSKENDKLQLHTQNFEQYQILLKNNAGKIQRLERKLKVLKDSLSTTHDFVAEKYSVLCGLQSQHQADLGKLNRTTETLLEIIKKKDEEIFRIQSERNYLSLKLQGIV